MLAVECFSRIWDSYGIDFYLKSKNYRDSALVGFAAAIQARFEIANSGAPLPIRVANVHIWYYVCFIAP